MGSVFPAFNTYEDDACALQAGLLMQQAIDLLDLVGEVRAAVHLQHAIETLSLRPPGSGQPH